MGVASQDSNTPAQRWRIKPAESTVQLTLPMAETRSKHHSFHKPLFKPRYRISVKCETVDTLKRNSLESAQTRIRTNYKLLFRPHQNKRKEPALVRS